jgi:hypothetical protein
MVDLSCSFQNVHRLGGGKFQIDKQQQKELNDNKRSWTTTRGVEYQCKRNRIAHNVGAKVER